MARRLKLLTVEVVTDDETGIYAIGELDFGVPSDPIVHRWIRVKRKEIAIFLRDLAIRCENGHAPFSAHLAEEKGNG